MRPLPRSDSRYVACRDRRGRQGQSLTLTPNFCNSDFFDARSTFTVEVMRSRFVQETLRWHVVFICLDVDQPCAAVNSRELFTIDGHCQSSCTLFLAIRDVSVSRSATRLFHASHDRSGNVSPSNAVHMLNAYNPKLREYVTANHYTDTLAFHAYPVTT